MERFSGRALVDGRWPLIGEDREWKRESWPFPALARRDVISGKFQMIRYDDQDPSKVVGENPCSHEEGIALPRDGLAGDGAVEIVLTALINGEPVAGYAPSKGHQ